MAAEQIVIVGAGPAGLATARSYREHGGNGQVTLLGEERLAPYRRPPLTKGFLCGETMRSPAPDGTVLAVGDVGHAYNASAGRALRVEHWGDAIDHGEVAGRALAGQGGRWDSVPGFWSTIGAHTLKYAAWGDGYEEAHLRAHPDGAFTVWYARDGLAVGVRTHERDEDYERGRELIRRGERLP